MQQINDVLATARFKLQRNSKFRIGGFARVTYMSKHKVFSPRGPCQLRGRSHSNVIEQPAIFFRKKMLTQLVSLIITNNQKTVQNLLSVVLLRFKVCTQIRATKLQYPCDNCKTLTVYSYCSFSSGSKSKQRSQLPIAVIENNPGRICSLICTLILAVTTENFPRQRKFRLYTVTHSFMPLPILLQINS